MTTQSSQRIWNIALWAAQFVVGAPFVLFGAMKVIQPIAQLVPMMPWTAELPEMTVRLLGVIDVAGGLGLLLPGLTGIRPELTRLATIGSILLQLSAAIFHLARGEGAVTPLNFVFLALLVFIFWGRSTRVPLTPRATVAKN